VLKKPCYDGARGYFNPKFDPQRAPVARVSIDDVIDSGFVWSRATAIRQLIPC
jgi:hypothetical protein